MLVKNIYCVLTVYLCTCFIEANTLVKKFIGNPVYGDAKKINRFIRSVFRSTASVKPCLAGRTSNCISSNLWLAKSVFPLLLDSEMSEKASGFILKY